MVDAKPVRVGIAGGGAIAQVSHLPAYAHIPGVALTAICDSDAATARRLAARYNVPHVFTSYEQLADCPDVDAVDICLPNHLHAPAAIASLRAGKHVLCAKPFSRSSAEARSMVEAARAANRVLMGGFNNRFREDANVLKRFVSEGELGNVFFVKTGWLRQPKSWKAPKWSRVKRYAGGGVLLDLGVQMLDLALWFLDMPAVETVSASAYPRPSEDALETSASAHLRLAGGTTLSLEVSWGLLMEKDFAYLNLVGDPWSALLNPLRLQKEMHGSLCNGTPSVGPGGSAYKQSYENELRHFVDCVRTGKKPLSPGEHAVRVLAVLEAMVESAVSGREVRLA